MKKILFVCTGNTCRSPMAAALLKYLGKGKVEVRSAGVFAAEGAGASTHAVTAMSEKGIPFKHESKPLTETLVRWADLVLTMTESHKHTVCHQYPEAVEKAYTLKEYIYQNDDYEKQLSELHQAYAEIETIRAFYKNKWDQADTNDKQAVQEKFEADIQPFKEKIISLENSLPSLDIIDPFGGSIDLYRETRAELESLIEKLIKKI
ncbi:MULTISPECIES: low molecular weight protein arginine phosphatase [unclassified Fictibacillus]|uniref:low molecular weight protein arginine phosphatase n=1 Tax=unclassified Fictibacillus TaxID=2644029 RepID=UPI00223E72A9|nr:MULTISPECIES: low molecular weight protein arginine phosphatase [unclassified Fictibacillus]MED2970885.1 low molecular weight protein arginine phosphatase [Fictibacillus sp. B-59209]UZJ79169.1 low molecular weight protein arginine phosphatase [Fictibacillus sp. KU28468]